MKAEGYLLSFKMLNKNTNGNISAPKRVSNVGGRVGKGMGTGTGDGTGDGSGGIWPGPGLGGQK
ncbi:hypothetical protein KY284_032439 [Solanum tuberosum]|nr:hypothetical protein KY284_032439 [Solanum tuberosum]